MYNIIVNPFAGNGLAKSNIKKVSKYLKKEKIPFLVYFTERENEIQEFATSLIKKQETDFIIVGGDGTINKFVNSVPDLNKIKIGIIPSGKSNNFAKALMINKNPIVALQSILDNKIQKYDILQCGNIKILNCLSFGAMEIAKYNIQKEKKNVFHRLFEINYTLKKFEPIKVNIKGEEIEKDELLLRECYIANGISQGKSNISPLSNLQDGLFNVIGITFKDKVIYKEYLKIRKGKHIYDEQNKTFWANSINIETDKTPTICDVDGELIEINELAIKIIPNGINIYQSDK